MAYTCEPRIEQHVSSDQNKEAILLMPLLRGMKRYFAFLKPAPDICHISPHLRRDAGIDEVELEKIKLSSAPLIR